MDYLMLLILSDYGCMRNNSSVREIEERSISLYNNCFLPILLST